jgi:photosystem II stability/assembly factor-like uncharacterized protein
MVGSISVRPTGIQEYAEIWYNGIQPRLCGSKKQLRGKRMTQRRRLMCLRKRWGVLGLSLALASALLALTVGLLAAAGGLWAPLGPNGGAVVQLAAADTNPATLYARTGDFLQGFVGLSLPGSGIWKSTNRGDSWQPTTLGLDAASGDSNVNLGAMAVSADGHTVCGAQSTATILGPPPIDTRIWCSTNGGNSWHSSTIPTSTVRALVVLNNTSGRVVAGSAMGNARPLFYSDDDGTSWHQATVLSSSNQIEIYALAEGSAYAGGDAYVSGTWRPVVFTSTDGITWRQAFTDTSSSDEFVQIVADPTDSQRAYAIVGGGGPIGGGEVFSTTNKGQSWAPLANQPGMTILAPGVSALAVDSQGRIYASVVSPLPLPGLLRNGKVYRSDDHGVSWVLVGQMPDGKGIDSLVVDPNDDAMLYVASGDYDHSRGVYRTPSGAGVSAAAYSFQPVNQDLHAYGVLDIAGNTTNPSVIYAATYDQGVLKSSDGGSSWSRVSEGVKHIASGLAVHPGDANIVYFGTSALLIPGPIVYRSTDGGDEWQPLTNGVPPGAAILVDLAIDPLNPSTLYAAGFGPGGGGLLKTTNSGDAWNPTAVITTAYATAIHPTTPNTIYVAVDNALEGAPGLAALYKSINGGTVMQQMAVGQDCMSDVLVNPNAPNEVFALSCYGVFLKSINDGAAWTTKSLTPTLDTVSFPYNVFGFALPRLAYDSRAGSLFASFGAYGLLTSLDGGATWAKVTDAPDMAMHAAFYQPGNNALYVGGSQGVWKYQLPGQTFLPAIKKDAP